MEAYNPKIYNIFEESQNDKAFKDIKMFDTTCVDPDNWMVEKFESVCEEVAEENKIFLEKSLNTLQTVIDNDNNTMNANSQTLESFSNLDKTIEYNKNLSEKQEVQKDNIQKIQDKEQLLEKTDALLRTSYERNSFKRKIIYSLVAFIFLMFILSIAFYIHYVRDFKPPK
jgi:hypothetical protein